MFSARPTQPPWSLSSPVLGQVRGAERKGSQRSQVGKARHAAGRDLKKRELWSLHVRAVQTTVQTTLTISFLLPSPMSRKTPSVTTQLRTRARLHPHQGASPFFRARKPGKQRRPSQPMASPVLECGAGTPRLSLLAKGTASTHTKGRF